MTKPTQDTTERSSRAVDLTPPPTGTVGVRCARCKGRVRWSNGVNDGRPSHAFAQDYEYPKLGARGGHNVLLESGEPDHYWLRGLNGGLDRRLPSNVAVANAQVWLDALDRLDSQDGLDIESDTEGTPT